MSRVPTVFICILIAAAAAGVIYAMFREQPSPPTASPQARSANPQEVPESPQTFAAESAPRTPKTSPGQNQAPLATPSTPSASNGATATATHPLKPLQHIAALSVNDRALRDRATQALIDQAKADPDSVAKLLEELHAAFDSATSNGKLRIMYVAAAVKGDARQNIDDPKAPAAMIAGVHYLENHLNDPELANFAPQESFTHIALSKGENGQWVWLLDDIQSSRGINLYFDPTNTNIIRATTWPKPR